MNPLDRYIEIILQYVVKYGENVNWTPFLINKVFLQVMVELDLVVPFSIGNHPIISQTQKQLHEDYGNGIISSNPKNIFTNVGLKSKNNLSDLELDLDIIYESFNGIKIPYIRNTKFIKSKIKQIGGEGNFSRTKKIEEIVDNKILSRIDDCRNLDYVDPKIESNLKYIQRIDDLDGLCNIFTDYSNSITLGEAITSLDREKYVLQKIKEGFKYGKKATKLVRPTNPYNSLLKQGKIDYVTNFRYLEFIRDNYKHNYKPIIFDKNNEKFIVALGKINKDMVAPSWSELYFFNITGKSEDEISDIIDKLEQFMVLLLANKFPIDENWKEQIVLGTNNLKKLLIADNENEILNQFGNYGGEVCIASLCITKDTINFPMSETEVKEYLTKVHIQLIRALSDLRIHSIIKENEEIRLLNVEFENIKNKDVLLKLKFFEEKLSNIYEQKLGVVEGKRPLYLLDVITGNRINCEGFVALSLFLLFNNPEIFPIDELKIDICCAPLFLLQEIFSNSTDRVNVNENHMFIIFEFQKEKFLFDPTGILKHYKPEIVRSIIRSDLYLQIRNITIEKGMI